MMRKYHIAGVSFVDADFDGVNSQLSEGGVLVVPAAPAFAEIKNDPSYYASLQKATVAIFDSGFMCLLLLLRGIRVRKLSGLKYLRYFLAHHGQLRSAETRVFTIDPSERESTLNRKLLETHSIDVSGRQYVAPVYSTDEIVDAALIQKVLTARPDIILINLGGGVQERLGVYIWESVAMRGYKPKVICTGAAIAFLTGAQAAVPSWMDEMYLGWLARVISSPRRFGVRYLSALRLIPVLLRAPIVDSPTSELD